MSYHSRYCQRGEYELELVDIFDLSQRRGPPTQFRSWHLLAAFHTFCKSTEPIGRYQLREELELGGGSIRSLIRFLRTRGLIEPVDRQGHQLSDQGRKQCKTLNKILIKLVGVPPSSYTVDIENVACQLRNVAHHLTDGLAQRDAAKQAGASGATTLYQGNNPEILTMPADHSLAKTDFGGVLTPFTFQPGDVLIIGSAQTRMAAQLGALAAALTLLEK